MKLRIWSEVLNQVKCTTYDGSHLLGHRESPLGIYGSTSCKIIQIKFLLKVEFRTSNKLERDDVTRVKAHWQLVTCLCANIRTSYSI